MNDDTGIDPYLIPGTSVLCNLVNAHSEQALSDAESDLVNARYSKLSSMPLAAEGTVKQLQWIHYFLFQDVYEWAGQIRTIDMSKGGGSVFQPLRFFPTGVQYAENMLQNDHMLQGLDRDRFIERLASNYDNFNTLHPFREGNGRTQRVFWTLIARDAGWGLDWSKIAKHDNDYASFIAHENVDYKPLETMFERIAQPLSLEQDRTILPAIGFAPETTMEALPNVYQVLSEQDYRNQQERLGYQWKGEDRPKQQKSAKQVREQIKFQAERLSKSQTPQQDKPEKRRTR